MLINQFDLNSMPKSLLEICTIVSEYINDLDIISNTDFTVNERDSDFGLTIEELFSIMRTKPIDAIEHSLRWIESMANLAIKLKVGNCVEKSCLAIKKILTFKQDISVELFSIPGQDHYFVVLNRLMSNINNPAYWKKDCVLLDPLDNCFFCINSSEYNQSRIKKLINASLKSQYAYGAIPRFRLESVVTEDDYEIDNSLNGEVDDEYWPDVSDETSDDCEVNGDWFKR